LRPKPNQAFIVSHTHWDREWYLTSSQFRVMLGETVDRVLDALDHDPEFRQFVLDGQSAALEDYLEISPGQRARVERLVQEGRLKVGPWYILPDEFLVSGEATVRNLIRGRKAAPLGKVQTVGYLPDSFGHPAQIPQLLRLAGIDSFIFTRGLGDEGPELGWLFRWAAPDGSEVLAVNQCDGYCNAGGLGFSEIWHAHTRRAVDPAAAVAKVGDLFDKMAARPGGEPALLNNGCDHFPPQQEFGRILAALRAAFDGTDFTHGGFEDFLAAARRDRPDSERPLHAGELLDGRDHLILSGVWSARMPLKQKNEDCQNLLARIAEPLAAAAALLHDRRWPGGLFDLAWKQLLLNHPHDSICGCSIDAVHREMDTRFAVVKETGRQILSRLLNELTPMFAARAADDRDTVIGVANPLPVRRDEVIDRLVVLQPLAYDLDNLRLLDDQGRAVPCEIVGRRYLERFWGVDYRAELYAREQLALQATYLNRFGDRIIGTARDRDTLDCFLHVRFLARDLPAVGHAQYRLTDRPDDRALVAPRPIAPVTAKLAADFAVLGNEHLEVTLYPDGTFDLLDIERDRDYEGLNLLEDAEDCGDEYDYSPARSNAVHFAGGSPGKLKITDHTRLKATAEATFRFDLPRSLTRGRDGRDQRTTPCDVTVRLTLHAGGRRVEVATEFNNRAFDHRLRAWFPTGIAATEAVSDGHFMLNRRPIRRPSNPDWDQPAPPTWPQQDFTAVQDTDRGLAVLNRGLPEFETFTESDGKVIFALTLLRCVDWLSRDDFPTRKNTNAGPTLHTPDAQCIGRHTFRYAVVPFGPCLFAADIKGESERYRSEPPTHQGVVCGMTPGGRSLVEKSAPEVAVTAIKLAETGRDLVVRLYNQATTPVTEILTVGRPVAAAAKTSLLEGPLAMDREPVAVLPDRRQVRIPLAPCEIATVVLTLANIDAEEKP